MEAELHRAPDLNVPLWVRLIGGRWYDGGAVRTWWGEFSPGWHGVGIEIGAYETAHLHIAAVVFQVFIRLPFLDWLANHGPNALEHPRIGFTWHATALHLYLGLRSKVINMPWQRRYLFREFLGVDGAWRPVADRARDYRPGHGVEAVIVRQPYRYMLDGGEVQDVIASVARERHHVVHVWFGDSGRFRKAPVSDFLRRLERWLTPAVHSLDIAFSSEVGQRAGSWKGGCVGCGWDMKPGETISSALLRMQRTRRFR